MLLIMPNIARVRSVISGWQGGPGLATHYFDASVSFDAAAAAAVAGRVRGSWDVVKSVLSNTTTITVDSVVDVLDDSNGVLIASFGITPPAAVTGTVVQAIGPAFVAAGLTLDTGQIINGKRLRGRTFISPLPLGNTGSATPPTGLVTGVNAMGVALVTTTPTSTSNQLVVWRRPKGAAAGLSRKVLSSVTAPKYFSIRSRRD